jgi:hypothetical protein
MKTSTHFNVKNNQIAFINMSIYLHYIMTYIPIVGSMLGGFILSNQLLARKTIDPKYIYIIFIFSAICSIYNFSITKFDHLHFVKLELLQSVLNEKILFIKLSVFSLFLLGISSILGLFLSNSNYENAISLAILISIIALFSAIFLIRSEYIKPNWEFYSMQIK